MSARKSPKVSKSEVKPIKKYASRHVGDVLQTMIDEALPKIKSNPKSTSKWMSKMKLSIQRKVSKFASIAYVTKDDNIASIKAEIKDLKANIANRLKNIQQASLQIIKSRDLSEPSVSNTHVPTGSYSSSTKNILDKFKAIAEQLNSVERDATDRFAKFNASLRTIDSNLPTVLSSLSQRVPTVEEDIVNFTNYNDINNGRSASSRRTGYLTSVAVIGESERDDAVIDKLIEHLEGSS